MGLEGTEAWQMIAKGYVAPVLENTGELIPLENLADDEKKKFAIEKKAFSQLSHAINTDLLHQFGSCTTSKQLWDMLKNCHDGNEKTRKLRMEVLKEKDAYQYWTINELIQKLENKELEEKRKARRSQFPQNPELYHASSTNSVSSSSV